MAAWCPGDRFQPNHFVLLTERGCVVDGQSISDVDADEDTAVDQVGDLSGDDSWCSDGVVEGQSSSDTDEDDEAEPS